MPREVLRLIVADDEALARQLVREYVGGMPDVTIVSECADSDALQRTLALNLADAALLDVCMPGRDVFDVLTEATARGPVPAVVFATAYDRYAVRAFEVNAVDYLVKPFTEARLGHALSRLRERSPASGAAPGLPRLLRDLGRTPDRLLVPDGQRIVPLPVSSVSWVQAEGDYSRIHVAGRSYLVYRTLSELEQRLDAAAFLRIHRSAIVRLDQIAEVRAADSGRHHVVLVDGTRLIVSRSRAAALKSLML